MGVSQTGTENDGTPLTAADDKPYNVIGHLNCTGSVLVENGNDYLGSRPDVTQEQAIDMDYVKQALIPMSSETHWDEDVAVYAKSPYAHLFGGTLEQSVIFHVMHKAAIAE
jgi:alkaline phosphatase